MQKDGKIPLTTSEISGLWNTYMGESMAICVLKYFLNIVEDKEIQSMLQYSISLINQHFQELNNIFNQEGLTLPEGFTDKDVDVNTPRLFDDEFYILYLANMARSKMFNYTDILGLCMRPDIRNFFTKLSNDSIRLYNKVLDLELSKGISIRFPCVEVLKKVEYMEKQSMLADWFGEKRTMLVSEITNISRLIMSNILGRTITMGFGQVSRTKEVSDYMFKGMERSSRRVEAYSSILTDENIPSPSFPYLSVTDSTIPPFSDKLMMFHVATLGTFSIIYKGIAVSQTIRADIQSRYIKNTPEDMLYSKEGLEIMIKNGWFEQPPRAIRHEDLVIV